MTGLQNFSYIDISSLPLAAGNQAPRAKLRLAVATTGLDCKPEGALS